MQVTICGPNLPRRLTATHGDSHAHAAGCRDLDKYPREHDGSRGWTIEVSDRRELIEAVWGDIMGDYSPPAPWTEYEDDTYCFPCLSELPREVEES